MVAATVLVMLYLGLSRPPIDQEIDNSSMFESSYGACPFPGKKVELTPNEWKERLNPEQFALLREGKTETSSNDLDQGEGTYLCGACKLPVFRSQEKFESETGLLSFWAPINPCFVGYKINTETDIARVEVRCNRCASHLGFVYEDGPPPTFHRYSVNSKGLDFVDVNLSPVEIPNFNDPIRLPAGNGKGVANH